MFEDLDGFLLFKSAAEVLIVRQEKRSCMKMKIASKRISMILIVMMVFTMIPSLTITTYAAAAPQLNLYVVGKDGRGILMKTNDEGQVTGRSIDPDADFAWTQHWYFQEGSSARHWLDSRLTSHEDGSGTELSLVRNFDQYPGFEDTGALTYSGFRYNGGFPCLAVCKRGILLEDLIDYAESESGYTSLRGETGLAMMDPGGWILPYSDDPAVDGKYSDFIWNGAVDRYYYPDLYEHAARFDLSAVKDYIKDSTKVKVPAVLSMVGFYNNNAGASLEASLDNADTERSLRLFFGTSTVEGDDLSAQPDIANNMGNYSGSNMQDIIFYPVYYPITVDSGRPSGTEGSEGYTISTGNVNVTAGDNWFRAAQDELVKLTVVPEEGKEVESVRVLDENGDEVAVSRGDSNQYRFYMPAGAVTVDIAAGEQKQERPLTEMTVLEQEYGQTVPVEKKVFSSEEMVSLDEEGEFYYGGFNSEPAVVQGKADLSVSLKDLLKAADVECRTGDQLIFRSEDGEEKSSCWERTYRYRENGRQSARRLIPSWDCLTARVIKYLA